MKRVLLLSFFHFFFFSVFGQTGSAASPFTSLGNARTVSTPGIYYFNLGGTQFSSYVNSNGLVLIATDFGGAAAANLPQVTALTGSGRGILSSAVLAALSSATSAELTTNNGVIDVLSSHSTILSRITTNATLHMGVNDIAINAGWTGTGNARVRGGASSCASSAGTTLNANIHHPCGDNTAFHWIPGAGIHRTSFNTGESAGTVQFNLWVGASLVALPVALTEFKAVLSSNQSVQLSWITQTEVNSAYFMVERSSDAIHWSPIAKLNAHNNTSQPTTYSKTDNGPGAGNNFYRLKMVDLDGTIEYSKTIWLSLAAINNAPLTVYPNPGRNLVYINLAHPGSIKIVNYRGGDITEKVKISQLTDSRYSIDFSKQPKGIYIIKGDNFSRKIVIE